MDKLNTEVSFRRTKVAIALMQFGYGGAERMVTLLASHLDTTRFDVRVFCVYGEPLGNVMETTVINHGVPIEYIGKGLGFSIKAVHSVWRALSAFSPDVVHTHLSACIYCAPWVAAHKVKMLHTLHNIPEKELGGIKRLVMKVMYRTRRAIPVAISQSNRRLTAEYYGLPYGKVGLVVNPVEVEAFRDSNPVPWEKRSWDFICVARLNEQKNHKLLIEAINKLVSLDEFHDGASIKLALVGSGPLEEEIRNTIRASGLEKNISMLGKRDDISELLHDSKCFILTSSYEGLPMTILEAMAAGLPVVAPRVGGISDIVEDGITGLLVEPNDLSSLINAMKEMVSNQNMLDSMSAKAKRAVVVYDADGVANEYGELYERVGSN